MRTKDKDGAGFKMDDKLPPDIKAKILEHAPEAIRKLLKGEMPVWKALLVQEMIGLTVLGRSGSLEGVPSTTKADFVNILHQFIRVNCTIEVIEQITDYINQDVGALSAIHAVFKERCQDVNQIRVRYSNIANLLAEKLVDTTLKGKSS